MTSLRESIRHFESRPSSRVFHAPQKAAQARAELEERLAKTGVKQPDTQRMYRAYLALQQAAATGAGGMESISIANLKLAPWVLFTPVSDGSEPLATDQELVKAYLREVIRRARTSVTVALVAAFLMIYPTQLAIFNLLRERLANQMLPAIREMRGLRIEKWIACIENCDLLDEQAPKLLAKRLADDELPPSALLDRCCLRGLLANSALVEQAYREWITLVSDQLRANRSYDDSLTRLLTFARAPDNASKLRYESSRAGLANGLLLPFADASPSPEAAQRVKSFLLDTLGDPRLTGAKQWHGVDERARAVMLRWLVAATLEDFFRLLAYAAKHDEVAARHWKARKAFWTKYLNAGYIQDAWVALGPRTEVEARGFLSEESRVYAKLSGGLPNHSVIIMRLGPLTITEWSHSGTFRAWFAGNRHAPALHKRKYTRDQLIDRADGEQRHQGYWQGKVSTMIYQQTGFAP